MLFATNKNLDNMLHIGDIVGDLMDTGKYGIVMGAGDHGVRVCWTNIQAAIPNDNVFDLDPLQLVLLTKAVQC